MITTLLVSKPHVTAPLGMTMNQFHGGPVFVLALTADGAAAQAGMVEGDALIAVNDQQVEFDSSPTQAALLMSSSPAGTIRLMVRNSRNEVALARMQMEMKDVLNRLPSDWRDVHECGRPFIWQATLDGPEGSLYEGGAFIVRFIFPATYPTEPPSVRFATRCYHPNIASSSDGAVQLASLWDRRSGISLAPSCWQPSTRMTSVLGAVRDLLAQPHTPESLQLQLSGGEVPCELDVARVLRDDHDTFVATCIQWVHKYAMPE